MWDSRSFSSSACPPASVAELVVKALASLPTMVPPIKEQLTFPLRVTHFVLALWSGSQAAQRGSQSACRTEVSKLVAIYNN